ncbi:hypothetical protein BJP36_40750 [Moorena producens JHB]|uniref:Uncharacterized protein n=1 Tax=Moorena producens (strain JHB) TaxID=1454205 RepID=A0A9Q9SSA7_MOOP1|nr:hypothetical protein [Moorena producens]WAN68698.1 hypothetical protein BJP36_40750 [Moorena producens JHB]
MNWGIREEKPQLRRRFANEILTVSADAGENPAHEETCDSRSGHTEFEVTVRQARLYG